MRAAARRVNEVALWLGALAGASLVAAFMCLGSADGTALSDFPLDDAWIHQVYARSLWFEGRLAYNPGVWESGLSSLAWIVVSLPVQALSTAWPVVGAKLVSLFFAMLTAVGAARFARQTGALRSIQALAMALVLATPGFAFSAVSGMEPTLTSAALIWGWSALIRPSRRGLLQAGLWFAVAVWARQEAAVAVAVAGVVPMISLSRWRERVAGVAMVGGPAVLALAMWWLITWRTTGYPLPNTFYVKAELGPLSERASYVWHLVSLADGFGVLAVSTIAVVAGAWWARKTRQPAVVVLVAAVLAAVVAVAVSRPMIEPVLFYTQRYFTPFTILLAPVAALSLEHFTRMRLAAVAGGALVLINVPGLFEARASYQWHCHDIGVLHTGPALRAKALVPEGDSLGVEGAGAARYLSQRHIVDLVGLNDRELAHARDDPRRFGCLLVKRKPQWLLIPGDMVEEMSALFELEPVEDFRVERWSVIDGVAGRVVLLLRAHPREAMVSACQAAGG